MHAPNIGLCGWFGWFILQYVAHQVLVFAEDFEQLQLREVQLAHQRATEAPCCGWEIAG